MHCYVEQRIIFFEKFLKRLFEGWRERERERERGVVEFLAFF